MSKHTMLGALLEVELWKKCTPLWREAHLEVKSVKTRGGLDQLLEVAMVKKCTPLWHEAHFEVKSGKFPQSRSGSDHFWDVRMSKKCTPLWRGEAHLEVKSGKTHHVRTTFGRCDVEKVHAVVVRSTFRSKKWQNTPCSDDFWTLRCRKSAVCCGAKHISQVKSVKTHQCSDHFWTIAKAIRCRQQCTPLWRDSTDSKSKVSKTAGYLSHF